MEPVWKTTEKVANRYMVGYEFGIETPINFFVTGKFQAPSSDWIHMRRHLFDYELIVMTEGILYIAGDANRYAVQKGQYLLLSPQTEQYGYKASNCSFYWLHFSYSNEITEIDLSIVDPGYRPGRIIIPRHGSPNNIEKIIVMMKQLQDSVRSYSEKYLNNYFSTLILCEIYNQFRISTGITAKKSNHQMYNDILDYIKWNCQKDIRVSHIAEHFGYNEKYLSHLFTQVSGTSLKQYILLQKMEVAKFILTDTNNSINEISAQLGYSDCHNFMKAFKKVAGLTPTEYRNAYSKRLLYYK
jgi:AraC-like DNA-binding protein